MLYLLAVNSLCTFFDTLVPPSLFFPDLADCGGAISLKEGCDHSMDFLVVSDPSLDTQSGHFLSKEGGFPYEDHVYLRGKVVYFKSVRRSDAGKYTVSSLNAAGEGKASFKLKIKCEW